MYTAEKVIEVLHNIGVSKEQIEHWERFFVLQIPKDNQGKKFYTDKHIKLFKAIKKELALGHKLIDIRRKFCTNLLPKSNIKPEPSSKLTMNPIKNKLPVNLPVSPNAPDNLHLIMLVERILDEKNQLAVDRDYLLEQVHVLEMDKQALNKATSDYMEQISRYANQVLVLEEQLQTSIAEISPQKFVGAWSAKATLIKEMFNTIDIDIPKDRNKSFKVVDLPKRIYCNMAVFVSSFRAEDDPLWERTETYRVVYINDEELKGELDVEYFVDDVVVAKAIYAIHCTKKV